MISPWDIDQDIITCLWLVEIKLKIAICINTNGELSKLGKKVIITGCTHEVDGFHLLSDDGTGTMGYNHENTLLLWALHYVSSNFVSSNYRRS